MDENDDSLTYFDSDSMTTPYYTKRETVPAKEDDEIIGNRKREDEDLNLPSQDASEEHPACKTGAGR